MTARHYLQVLQREGQVGAPQTVRRTIPCRPSLASSSQKRRPPTFQKNSPRRRATSLKQLAPPPAAPIKFFLSW